MGIKRNDIEEVPKRRKIQKIIILLLSSTLVSLIGGVILAYWFIKYHPKSNELWMVPVGLVMFTTPPLVWLISIVAEFCCPQEEQQQLDVIGLSRLTSDSVDQDLER
ncbi:unnamed protein product [Amaranthus hypochondriacus]